VLLLLFVQHAERVEDEIRVAEGFDASLKLFRGLLKLKRAARDLHNLLKCQLADILAARCIDDATVVESHLALAVVAGEGQNSVQSRIFDDLHRVEDAHGAEVAGEGEVFAFEMGFRSGDWLQIGTASAANCLKSTCNVYPTIECFGFEEAVVGRVEVFALDVNAGEGETVARGLFVLLVSGADLAQALAQFDRAAAYFEGGAEAFYGPFRRLVLDEELGIEQSCFDLADVLSL